MIKVPVIGATALLFGIGCAWAIDDSNKMSPTGDQGVSGQSSAMLSQEECQTLWNDARNQSGGVSNSASAESNSPAQTNASAAGQKDATTQDTSSNGRPAETSKSVALEDSRAAVENDANTSAASRATGTSTDTNASVAGKKDGHHPRYRQYWETSRNEQVCRVEGLQGGCGERGQCCG